MGNPVSSNLRSTPAVAACVVGTILAISIAVAPAQALRQKEAGPGSKPLWQRGLEGGDARRAAELNKDIETRR
jgi:hypothetical protein